jgi:subtilisin family serine protease
MFTRLAIAVSAIAALTVTAAAPTLAADTAKDSGPRASYIVQFVPGASSDAEAAKAQADGAIVKQQYRKAINGMAVELSPGQLKKLQADPNVALIEPDATVTISATQSPVTWGLDRSDQRALPLSNSYSYTATAPDVTAYVIDTGVLTNHVDLAGRVDAAAGFTAYADATGTSDCNGHGTHVAGTIGGTAYGIAKGVRIVPVRVLSCTGTGSSSGLLAGIEHVINQHQPGQPAVANMSLGFGAVVSTVDTAVANLVADGVSVAVAAGNSNLNACNDTPARVPSVITVGATTSTDARSSFSNFGSCLDIFAPGSSITSAWFTSTTAVNTISGTSMASPHVAGAAALYLAANSTATPAQVASALITSSTPNKVTSPGTGSPNRLLFVGTDAPAAPPVITSLSQTTGPVGSTVLINGSGFTGATRVDFNGTASTVFAVNSDTQITAIVPSGAQSGSVTVTTPTAVSNGVAFTVTSTPVEAVPNAPTNLATRSITRTSATASWSPATTGGTPTSYQVKLSTSSTWTTVNGTSATLSGLRRNTSYTWQVQAVNSAGPSTTSQLTFRTSR